MNVASMNVEVTSVQFNGNQADATVCFIPRAGNAAQECRCGINSNGKDGRLGGDGPQGMRVPVRMAAGRCPGGARCGESA